MEHNGPSRYGEEVSIYVRDRPVTEAGLAAENRNYFRMLVEEDTPFNFLGQNEFLEKECPMVIKGLARWWLLM